MIHCQKALFTLALLLIVFIGTAQVTYESKKMKVSRAKVVEPKKVEATFNVQLLNKEAPVPDGDSYKAFLMEQKKKVREKYPITGLRDTDRNKTGALQPQIGKGIGMYRQLINGLKVQHTGGIPNDNTLAISNEGYLVGGINSVIWGYDINKDTLLLKNSILSLQAFVQNTSVSNVFDPKMIYDEAADRFILVFLQGNLPRNSSIIVCFSSTNDPSDPWYSYELPGNPLQNDRWTDFPAISITDDNLFITGNLIIPNVSWQVGFDGSVIWQLDKADGFANADSLGTHFYSDIRTNGRLIRNLHPVRGTASAAPTQYFLSNRNFDVSNDSIFVLEIDGTITDPNTDLTITVGRTNTNYGVPPNGRQLDTDQSDPTKGLQTNDGRVLGAITNGDWIQFVSTTSNPETGLAAIYHGHIQNPATEFQSIQGLIIGDSIKDYAYPNISFTGNEKCDVETVIGFNYTSPADYPGVAALYYNNDSSYSSVVTIKEGEDYVDKHSDSYERWGDYFGIQPKYNEPGKVWIGGFYGLPVGNNSGTWFNEIGSPDGNLLTMTSMESGEAQFCKGSLTINGSGGIPPYSYSFNGGSESDTNSIDGICNNDTVFYTIKDARGCTLSDSMFINIPVNTLEGAYPNPFSSTLVAQFMLEQDTEVTAYIFNESGRVIKQLLDTKASKGVNELRFNMDPLSAGSYIVQVLAGDKQVLVSKVFKVE